MNETFQMKFMRMRAALHALAMVLAMLVRGCV